MHYRWQAISAGKCHTCALVADTGAAQCWGSNGDGEATPPTGFAAPAAGYKVHRRPLARSCFIHVLTPASTAPLLLSVYSLIMNALLMAGYLSWTLPHLCPVGERWGRPVLGK